MAPGKAIDAKRPPSLLAPIRSPTVSCDPPEKANASQSGFHQYQGKLVAYFGNYGPGMKNTRLEAVTTTDGSHWSSPISMGVPVNPNHGPQPTASGRLIISGNISFPYTDDPSGLTGWKMSGIYPESMAATLEDNPRTFWEIAKAQGWGASLCEGSFYQTNDRVLHMLLRCAGKHRHRLWLTESRDDGLSWSHPMETNFSDTDTKFHLGRLPDGRFYQVGSPIGKNRTPLVLSLSKNGIRFSEHYVLGDEHYERRQEGKWKLGEYGYPHTLVHEGHLYVIVSRQKEAVEVMRVALEDLDASKRSASSTSAPQQRTGAILPSSSVALTLASRPSMLKSEFIYDTGPFPQIHATTIVETPTVLLASWFDSTGEGAKGRVHLDFETSSPMKFGMHASRRLMASSLMSPGALSTESGVPNAFHKVGPSLSKWWGELKTSHDGGQSWSDAQKLPDRNHGPIKKNPSNLPMGTSSIPPVEGRRWKSFRISASRRTPIWRLQF